MPIRKAPAGSTAATESANTGSSTWEARRQMNQDVALHQLIHLPIHNCMGGVVADSIEFEQVTSGRMVMRGR